MLARRRDLGAAIYRQGPGEPSASAWLVRPVGLALHGQRGALIGWLVGSVALAAVMGALAQDVVGAILANPSLAEAMGITAANAADGFLASTQVYLAIIACGYVVQALGLLRHEEAAGRLEPVLAGGLGRTRWLGAQVLVVSTGLVVVVVLSAVAFGGATALSTGDAGYVGTLLTSGAAYLPAELVIAAVAVLLFGFLPRAFVLAWAAFGAVTFIGLLGSGLHLPDSVLNLSPLTHVGKPPVDEHRHYGAGLVGTDGGRNGLGGIHRVPPASGAPRLISALGGPGSPTRGLTRVRSRLRQRIAEGRRRCGVDITVNQSTWQSFGRVSSEETTSGLRRRALSVEVEPAEGDDDRAQSGHEDDEQYREVADADAVAELVVADRPVEERGVLRGVEPGYDRSE